MVNKENNNNLEFNKKSVLLEDSELTEEQKKLLEDEELIEEYEKNKKEIEEIK